MQIVHIKCLFPRGLSLFVVVVTFLSPAASAEVTDQAIMKGIDFMHRLETETALEYFDALISSDRNDPKAYFFKAGVYFWLYLATDFGDQPGVMFREISELAIDVAQARLKNEGNDQESLLYLGRAHANLGRYYAIEGRYLKAYWASRKGEKILRALVEEDPECFDAYLELGLYDYYMDVAKILKLFSILLGVEGDRHQGLRYLHLAAEKGELTRVDARFFLEDIYQRYEEDYEKAAFFAEALVRLYPSNVLFLSELAATHRQLGKFEKAITEYQEVLDNERIDDFPDILRYSRYQSARCLISLNRFDAAITAFEQIVTRAIEEHDTDNATFPWSLFQIGNCLELTGERDKAVASFERIRKEPDRSCYEAARARIKKPLTEFDISMEIAGNLLAQNAYNKALERYAKVLKEIEAGTEGYAQTDRPQVQFWIARTHQENGDCEKALAAFEHVLSSDTSSPKWLKPWADFRAGNCYAELGDRRRAENHYDSAYRYRDKYLRARISRDRQDLESTPPSPPQ